MITIVILFCLCSVLKTYPYKNYSLLHMEAVLLLKIRKNDTTFPFKVTEIDVASILL